jgi:glycosyltransferase involved in cell wall biosynthesis
MDALSKGMLRRAETTSGLRKTIFQIEGKRLSEYENRIFDYFNNHTIISQQDQELINHPSRKEIRVIENGISQDFFDYKTSATPQFDIVFVGNMNYPPNIECAEYLVNKILPLLEDKVTVALCGASPNQRIKNLASEGKVTVTGWIDDIKDAYSSGRIFAAPLFIGTGLQNKLLEAMALELPCITTELANNALNAEPNSQILVANTPQDFADKINKLLKEEKYAKKIGVAGKIFVQENFSWSYSVKKLEILMNGSHLQQ